MSMSGTWTHKVIHIFTAITEKGTKSFPKRLRHSIDRKGLTMKTEDFFKILTDLKTNGESYDGNVHYWISTRYEKDGEEYKAIKQIVADIPHEDKKYTEQITFDVKEL